MVVERVGTLLSRKDAISCQVRVKRIVARNSQKGICIALSFYGGSRLPYPNLLDALKTKKSDVGGVTTVN